MNAETNSAARPWTVATSVLAAAAAAVGASACCAGPLLLVLLGVGGAWGSSLMALEPYQPYFIAATLAFLAFAFHRLYVRPTRCAPDDACAIPDTRSRQKALFWAVSLFAIALVALPLYAPVFY